MAEMEGGAARTPGPRRMLNQAQVLELVPVSLVTLWRMEKRGTFPRGTFISPNRKIWYEDEIAAWQHEVDARRTRQSARAEKSSQLKASAAAEP